MPSGPQNSMSYVLWCGSSSGPGVPRVPRLDAVVQARLDARPEAAQPRRVAADAPLAVDLHDAAELAVGGGVEVVDGGPDGQRGAEGLVAACRPARRGTPSRAASAPAPGRGAAAPGRSSRRACRSRGSSPAVAAAFPAPEPAVRLAQHGGRLENGQVGGHRLDDLGRQRRVVEAVREAGGLLAQRGVARPPRLRRLLDPRVALRVPGTVAALAHGLVVLRIVSDAAGGSTPRTTRAAPRSSSWRRARG